MMTTMLGFLAWACAGAAIPNSTAAAKIAPSAIANALQLRVVHASFSLVTRNLELECHYLLIEALQCWANSFANDLIHFASTKAGGRHVPSPAAESKAASSLGQ